MFGVRWIQTYKQKCLGKPWTYASYKHISLYVAFPIYTAPAPCSTPALGGQGQFLTIAPSLLFVSVYTLFMFRLNWRLDCSLDPIPTTLTKQCLSDLVPMVTRIVNASLSTGVVPKQFKQAIVIPLLKKHNLDCHVFGNYRPVSNLPFISKILETVNFETASETSIWQ